MSEISELVFVEGMPMRRLLQPALIPGAEALLVGIVVPFREVCGWCGRWSGAATPQELHEHLLAEHREAAP